MQAVEITVVLLDRKNEHHTQIVEYLIQRTKLARNSA